MNNIEYSRIFVKTFDDMSVDVMPQPFTNLQLELLKLYAHQVSEQDLLEVRRLLAQYFMDKATSLADEVWEAEGFSEDVILGQHTRTNQSGYEA